jgi:hypothetical protein
MNGLGVKERKEGGEDKREHERAERKREDRERILNRLSQEQDGCSPPTSHMASIHARIGTRRVTSGLWLPFPFPSLSLPLSPSGPADKTERVLKGLEKAAAVCAYARVVLVVIRGDGRRKSEVKLGAQRLGGEDEHGRG